MGEVACEALRAGWSGTIFSAPRAIQEFWSAVFIVRANRPSESSMAALPLPPLRQRHLQRLPNEPLIRNPPPPCGGANRIEELTRDAQIHRFLLGFIFEWERRQILRT